MLNLFNRNFLKVLFRLKSIKSHFYFVFFYPRAVATNIAHFRRNSNSHKMDPTKEFAVIKHALWTIDADVNSLVAVDRHRQQRESSADAEQRSHDRCAKARSFAG